MSDDIRKLLQGAAPSGPSRAGFDELWDSGRRQRRWRQSVVAVAILAACVGAVVVIGGLSEPTKSVQIATAPDSCPVTIPTGGFVPPAPYRAQPSDGMVWYGTPELWTALDPAGARGPRKSVWWSENFGGGQQEPEPQITATWERLGDPNAKGFTSVSGTNAHTPQDGWFMIAGIDPDETGCWQVTATYRGAQLSYVYLVD